MERPICSSTGGIQIRIDGIDGPLVAQVEIVDKTEWTPAKARLSESPAGVHDLYVILKDGKNAEMDWIQFE